MLNSGSPCSTWNSGVDCSCTRRFFHYLPSTTHTPKLSIDRLPPPCTYRYVQETPQKVSKPISQTGRSPPPQKAAPSCICASQPAAASQPGGAPLKTGLPRAAMHPLLRRPPTRSLPPSFSSQPSFPTPAAPEGLANTHPVCSSLPGPHFRLGDPPLAAVTIETAQRNSHFRPGPE